MAAQTVSSFAVADEGVFSQKVMRKGSAVMKKMLPL
jgi:hypothetical protein